MSRTSKLAAAVAVLAILGTLGLTAFMPGPAAADDDDWVEINQPGYTINQPGKYKLKADLDFSGQVNGFGVRIVNTQNVELDLNGKNITGRPNQTYGGSGTGIYVFNSKNVEIDGKDSKIKQCENAVKIWQCKNVDLDGENMDAESCSTAIMVFKSEQVKIRKVDLEDNKQRDIHLSQCKNSEIRDCDLKGPCFQGILLADCKGITVRDTEIGKDEKIKAGIILFRSEDCVIDNCKIGRADNGIVFNGQGTEDNTVRKCDFGEPEDNDCDILILQGAEAPELDDNDPDNLKITNSQAPQ